MFGTIIKTIMAGAATAYAFIGAFSAWVLKETVNDVVDGAVAAYDLAHPDNPASRKERIVVKILTFLYLIVVFPVKFIASSIGTIPGYNIKNGKIKGWKNE